ncbi:hypothetical protein [Hungatella sp. SB206]|uniref:hypothetical protein n=1 Tax=Hungatella sp. SB206 TaxID=2937758 RepID=UPI003DA8590F
MIVSRILKYKVEKIRTKGQMMLGIVVGIVGIIVTVVSIVVTVVIIRHTDKEDKKDYYQKATAPSPKSWLLFDSNC